ncbi:MAG: hypothetical protein HC915_10715 [Anaerolineae bacterium]|nr:hypothetical protein [Anaerolineae bacterium]
MLAMLDRLLARLVFTVPGQENKERPFEAVLFFKRALIWVISFSTALVLSFLIVYVLLGTDIPTYSVKYFVLTVIPLGFFFLIWGDALLGTGILPD